MPRDYASQSHRNPSKGRKRQRKKRQHHPMSRWLRFLLLILLIIMVALAGRFFYRKSTHHQPLMTEKKRVDVTAAQPSLVKHPHQATQKPSELEFIFHQRTTNLAERPHYYELIVATVDQLSQADELRDRVEQLGYKVALHQVELGGDDHFRLEIGPYKTQAGAARVQTILQGHDIVTVIRAVH